MPSLRRRCFRGTFVTPETAIGLTAVYCAMNVISGDVACLPRHVYKTLDGGGLEIERDHPAEWLVGGGDPNEEMGKFRYVQTSMGHVLGRGNGFSEIVRQNGFPVSLEPLHPVKTRVKRTKTGKLYYELENKKELLPENVLHLAGLGLRRHQRATRRLRSAGNRSAWPSRPSSSAPRSSATERSPREC